MRRAPFLFLLLPIQGISARDDGQWTMPGRDYAATRYSGLSQITARNVTHLHPVWSFSTGVLGGHEGQPLVVGSTMYVVTPFPNVLYAFDLTREGYPLKWKYRPEVNPTALGIACCDAINRGAVYADGKIIYNLLDGHTVAVDAVTGSEVWKTQIADMNQGETTPMAPFVAGNRVIVGPSGGEFGIYGWVKGLDVRTGKILWTAHNMGPDSLMLARPGRGNYTADANIGVSTWLGDSWRRGGAPVWGWISYDPQLNLIYFGTGNPGPYNTEQRPGENKWTNSVLARRPGDGSLVWAYQFTPHDSWDYDSNAEMILVDLVVGGRLRKVLVHFDKNGFAYTIDRRTGELRVEQPLHEFRGGGGDAHSGDAVHRRDDTVFRRARRQHGRVSRVGRGAGPQGLGHQREVSGVERQRRHPRRRRVLRYARWLVQGRQRAHGQRAVEVQSGIRCRGRADLVSGTRRQAAHRRLRRHRRRLVSAFRRRTIRRSCRRPAPRRFCARPRAPHEPGRDRLDLRSLVLLACVAACERSNAGGGGVPVSVRYPDHVAAGGNQPPAIDVKNPIASDSTVVADGSKIFSAMNCDGCHGGGATGWVGPSLVDGRWRYGATDGALFLSIFYGRPRGMPAYGGVMSPGAIWKVIAYIRAQPIPSVVPTQVWPSTETAPPPPRRRRP